MSQPRKSSFGSIADFVNIAVSLIAVALIGSGYIAAIGQMGPIA